jgi:hypothetical protein
MMQRAINLGTFGVFNEIGDQRRRSSKFRFAYDPNRLFDALINHLAVQNDSALGKRLGISSLIILKIRQLAQPVSGTLLILIEERTRFTLSQLRRFMGDRRQTIRISRVQPR